MAMTDINEIECKWTGEFSSMNNHINNDCQLEFVDCPHCRKKQRRFYLAAHDKICAVKPIPCTLHCSMKYISFSSFYMLVYINLSLFQKQKKVQPFLVKIY